MKSVQFGRRTHAMTKCRCLDGCRSTSTRPGHPATEPLDSGQRACGLADAANAGAKQLYFVHRTERGLESFIINCSALRCRDTQRRLFFKCLLLQSCDFLFEQTRKAMSGQINLAGTHI